MSTASAIITMLGGAFLILGGLAALTRSVWRAAQDIRDNKTATRENTEALQRLAAQMDGRLTAIEQRLAKLEAARGH